MERKEVVRKTAMFMEGYNFLITPTTAAAAFDIGIEGPLVIVGVGVDAAAWVEFSVWADACNRLVHRGAVVACFEALAVDGPNRQGLEPACGNRGHRFKDIVTGKPDPTTPLQ